jgi:DNA-binding IclR family transcriptional regulator
MVEHRSAQATGRAIRLAIHDGAFKAPDVTECLSTPPSRQTVTRILRQLEDDGWLERTEPNSSIWRAGPVARRLGEMSEPALQQAERDAIGPD